MSKSFLYTRTGDAGTTSLRSGVRIAKNSIQVDAYGTVAKSVILGPEKKNL